MNPLLFADWGRMNRLFTRAMWAVAVVMLCVVALALASPTPRSHSGPPVRSVAPTAAAVSAGTAR